MFNKAQIFYLNKEFDSAEYISRIGIKVCKKLNLASFNEIHSELYFLHGNILQCKQKWKPSSNNYLDAV